MRILGIDPGYGITGFGLIEAQRGQTKLLRCGAITTPPNTDQKGARAGKSQVCLPAYRK